MQDARCAALAGASIDIDANEVAHRSATAAIARNDQTQRLTWQRGAVHVVGDLNRSASELRGDLGEGDDGDVSVVGFAGSAKAGINEHVPKRASPFVLLLITSSQESDAVSESRQVGDTLVGYRS